METTWKPIAAGVLNIVIGIATLSGMFITVVIIVGVSGSMLAISRIADFMPLWLSALTQFIIVIVAIFMLIISALPLIGGIYSIQRKNWRLALAGSIVAILSSTILGVVATILVSLSKNEFLKDNRFP